MSRTTRAFARNKNFSAKSSDRKRGAIGTPFVAVLDCSLVVLLLSVGPKAELGARDAGMLVDKASQ